ncbi:glycosyltransferase family 2 protein [Flagellimonas marinaquae]
MDISVVIPLFNKEKTIHRALMSVMEQSELPSEIIVVNDGSTDGSEQVVSGLNHPLVQLINQENAGVSAARNTGIAAAKYEWIAFLDADDVWLPEYLQTVHHLNRAYPQAQVLATAYWLQNYKGHKDKIRLNKIPFLGNQGLLGNYFQVASHSHPPLWSSAVVIRKSALLAVGGFPLGMHSGEDLLTWARLASRYVIAYNRGAFAVFIQDAAHTYDAIPKRIPDSPDEMYQGLVYFYKNEPGLKGLRSYIAHWKLMRANIFIRLNKSQEALKELSIAFKYNPLRLKLYVFMFIAVLPYPNKSSIFRLFSK